MSKPTYAYDLTQLGLEPGTYAITAKAKKTGEEDSPESNAVSYTAENPTPYIVYSSVDPFNLANAASVSGQSSNHKTWDGSLEYSTDASSWSAWNGSRVYAASDGTKYHIYIRGTSNTYMLWQTHHDPSIDGMGWYTTASSSSTRVSVSGNIESLLDYQTVLNGQHPTMGSYAFDCLFANDARLNDVTGLKLLANELTPYCYACMFAWTSITQTPELPALKLASNCYLRIFYNCTYLTTAMNELPAEKMESHCYDGMFRTCINLLNAPYIKSTNLAEYCYYEMFYYCRALTTFQDILPATALKNYCYAYMFYSCRALTNAPELPAITMATSCYQYMFYECWELASPPDLPATTLAAHCYEYMFYHCSLISTVPALPATTLANYCYANMFRECYNLDEIPELPATTLVTECYKNMFYSAYIPERAGIMLSETQTGDYQTPYRIPSSGTGTTGSNSLSNMFYGTKGTFTGTPSINTTYYTANTVIPATQNV